MNIAIDIDSVLSDSHTSLVNYLNEVNKTSMVPDDFYDFNMPLILGCTVEEADRILSDWYKTTHFQNMKILEGSIEAVNYLATEHNLYCVTSRPFEIEHITIKWINSNFPTIFKEITHTNDGSYATKYNNTTKSSVCKKIGAEVIIEDNIRYAADCAENGITTFLMEMPWNRSQEVHPEIIRVKNWKDFLVQFKKYEQRKGTGTN
ncbi:MAG: hypothetical protein ABIO02_03465 [Patescibacteria group bacterium]